MNCKCGSKMEPFIATSWGHDSGSRKTVYICVKCGFFITTVFDDDGNRILLKGKMAIKDVEELEE